MKTLIKIICLSLVTSTFALESSKLTDVEQRIENTARVPIEFSNQKLDAVKLKELFDKVKSKLRDLGQDLPNLKKTSFGYLSKSFRVWLDRDGDVSWVQGLNGDKFDLRFNYENDKLYSLTLDRTHVIFDLPDEGYYYTTVQDFSKYDGKSLNDLISDFTKEKNIDFEFEPEVKNQELLLRTKLHLKKGENKISLKRFLLTNSDTLGVFFRNSNKQKKIWIFPRAGKGKK